MKSWAVHRLTYYMLGMLTCAALPFLGGLGVFGWRAALVLVLVWIGTISSSLFFYLLRHLPLRTHRSLLLLYGAIIALFLPVQWADLDRRGLEPIAQWPLLIGCGVILTLCTWLVERFNTARVHPLIVSILLIYAAFWSSMKPDRVVERTHAFTGDLLDVKVSRIPMTRAPWLSNREDSEMRVIERQAPADVLRRYLVSTPGPEEATNLTQLIADQLPPLEDVMIGGTPNTMGSGSAVFVAVGGLFLVSRRRLMLRWPLASVAMVYLVVLIAPIPIERVAGKSIYRWCMGFDARVGWAMAVTLANYILCSGPMLLTTFFVMAMPGVRPIGPRAAMVFALLFGTTAALASIYISVALGPIVAIGLCSILSVTLDRMFIRRPLI